MGDIIQGTRFICMKVPLKPSLLHSVPKDSIFSCEHAIDMVTRTGRKLGLVIDLTFTRRYYNPLCFEKENILYKKIFMPGRVIPEQSIMQEFYNAVEDFEENNQANNDVIAVHCTHGLNRTGYMVCKYMVERKGIDADVAISMFEEARGHKMEREIYLADLKGEVTSSVDQNSNVKWQAKPPADRYRGHSSSMRFNQKMRENEQGKDRGVEPTDWQTYSDRPYSGDRHFGHYDTSNYHHQDYYPPTELSWNYRQDYYPPTEPTWNYNGHIQTPSHFRSYDNGYRANGYGHIQTPAHHRRYNGYATNGYGTNHNYGEWLSPWESQHVPLHGKITHRTHRSKKSSKSRAKTYDKP